MHTAERWSYVYKLLACRKRSIALQGSTECTDCWYTLLALHCLLPLKTVGFFERGDSPLLFFCFFFSIEFSTDYVLILLLICALHVLVCVCMHETAVGAVLQQRC
jgi:hypothetical protein